MVGPTTTSQRATDTDIEAKLDEPGFLDNDTVQSFAWRGVTVKVKDRETKEDKSILLNTSGHVQPGASATSPHYVNFEVTT